MSDDERKEVIDFIQDFGCARLNQLQTLFSKPKNNFKDILKTGQVKKKDDIFVYFNENIDMQMLYALDVLCKYKDIIKKRYRGKGEAQVAFITKENLLYYIIVLSKETENAFIKYIASGVPEMHEADRFILVFKDEECFSKIKWNKEYIYCTYPDLKIITKKKVDLEVKDGEDKNQVIKEYLKNHNLPS